MTKRDFFRIIIRSFALYLLLLILFNQLPTSISYIGIDFSLIGILYISVGFIILILLFFALMRKSDAIIDILKIDRGFDDDHIDLGNLSQKQILDFALILIGGFLFLDHLPEFFSFCYLGFKKLVSGNNLNPAEGYHLDQESDYFRWVFSGINILLGYLIITNYTKLSKFLLKNK
ncbi:hypothetical protein AB8P51_15200 [Muriicola sp. SD30]|uniref:hypothetical protein n=1 Tax=Muriicola sp. SD30 TaxID=3240936 RepID=UPI00351062F6